MQYKVLVIGDFEFLERSNQLFVEASLDGVKFAMCICLDTGVVDVLRFPDVSKETMANEIIPHALFISRSLGLRVRGLLVNMTK